MNTKKLLACSMFVATASVAQAAIVDYDALQDLFGEPVTLSATGTPQRASEAPASMEIIDAETIRRSAAQDIPDILRRAVGVDVRRNMKGNADVSIRGMNQAYSNRLLVLINGRQVYQDHYGVTYWDMLPVQLSEIKQIEVVRGPNSALFGFNAASGVINIVTYSPTLKDIDEVEVKLGTQEYGKVGGVSTYQLSDNSAVRVSASMDNGSDFNRSSMVKGSDEEDAIDSRSVNIDYESVLANGDVVRAEFTHGYSRGDVYSPVGAAESDRFSYSAKLAYDKETDFGSLKLTTYYNAFNEDLDASKFGSTLATLESDNDLFVAKAELLKKLNSDHTVRVATEYRRNNVNSNLTDEDEQDNLYYDVYSLSGMWNWQVNPKLSWTNSVRYDHLKLGRDDDIDATLAASGVGTSLGLTSKEDYSRRIDDISFNSTVMYKANSADTYKASVARGLRIPALVQFGNTALFPGAPSGLAFLSNPQLELEVNMTYEVGYSHKFDKYQAEAGANLFHQRISDVIGASVVPANAGTIIGGVPYTILGEYNTGNTESFGVELYGSAKPTMNTEVGANYTFNYFEDEQDSVFTSATGQVLTIGSQQPKHHANLWGRYTQGKFEYDGSLHYVSKASYPSLTAPYNEVDDYFVMNARVGYNLTDMTTVALEGLNILEEHNEAAMTTTLGSGAANELGRSVILSLRHKF